MKKISTKPYLLAVPIALVGIFIVATGSKAASNTSPVTINATILETMSFSCNNATFGNLTAGTPVNVQATCTATTNGQSGFNVKVRKTTGSADATKTLVHTIDGTTWIADSLAGYAGSTASTVVWGASKSLGFRVNVTASTAGNTNSDWGPDVTPEFAAFPVGDQTIYNYATYLSTASTVAVDYRLDVPITQKSGAYSGTVLYTATTN